MERIEVVERRLKIENSLLLHLLTSISQNSDAMNKTKEDNVDRPATSWSMSVKTLMEEIKSVVMD